MDTLGPAHSGPFNGQQVAEGEQADRLDLANTTDNEATNCSEDCFEQLDDQPSHPNPPQGPPTGHNQTGADEAVQSTTATTTLDGFPGNSGHSGALAKSKNRLGTPRRTPQAPQASSSSFVSPQCDTAAAARAARFQQNGDTTMASQQHPFHLCDGQCCSDATTLSLTSNILAPPSYGTAMRLPRQQLQPETAAVATLDAAQLCDNATAAAAAHSGVGADSIIASLGASGVAPAANANQANLMFVSSHSPGALFAAGPNKTTAIVGQCQPSTTTTPRHLQFGTCNSQMSNGRFGLPSSGRSGSLPRSAFLAPHPNQTNPASHYAPATQNQINFIQQQQADNNRQLAASSSTLIRQPGTKPPPPHYQQPQYLQTTTGLNLMPINHVISVAGSSGAPFQQLQQRPTLPMPMSRQIANQYLCPVVDRSWAAATCAAASAAGLTQQPTAVASSSSQSPGTSLGLAPIMDSSARLLNRSNEPHPAGPLSSISASHLLELAPGRPKLADESASAPARSSRKHQKTPASRKRRRHRSTSGRSAGCMSPSGDELGALGSGCHTLSRLQQQPSRSKQTISAQCWLIDSSDDQQSKRGSKRPTTARCVGDDDLADHSGFGLATLDRSKNLTMALMKQTRERQERQQQQQQAIQRSHSSANLGGSSATRAPSDFSPAAASAAVAGLTQDLAHNSQRLDNILAKRSPLDLTHKKSHRSVRPQNSNCQPIGSPSDSSTSTSSQSSPSSASPMNCSSASSPAGPQVRTMATRRAAKSQSTVQSATSNANAVVRLSAILSLVSSLVKRRPKCLKVGSSSPNIASSSHVELEQHTNSSSLMLCNGLHQDTAAKNKQRAANSISGSLAPYTAISFASSSTSAYATGLSHDSSSHRANREVPLARRFRSVAAASTAGSSVLYSSSGATTMPSSSGHGYEYCDGDGDGDEINETQFFHEIPLKPMQQAHHPPPPPSSSDSSTVADSANASATLNGSDTRLSHMMIMSDHELISASSELQNAMAAARFAQTLPAVHETQAASVRRNVVAPNCLNSARSRRRWMSVKNWFRHPCKTCDSNCSAPLTGGVANGTADQIEAARYKSLKSRRRKRRARQQSGSTGSTIQSIISLAKADRVFRCRLIASLLVSALLIALLCLLAGLIHSKSAGLSIYRNRNRLNGLFIDDSDYDLSWLWPASSAAQSASASRSGAHKVQYKMSPENAFWPAFDPIGGSGAPPLDSSLQTHLALVEASERLEQFQQTVTYLINEQLASDSYVDLTQFAKRLAPPPDPIINLTLMSSPATNNTAADTAVQLSQTDCDLISLTLLSNIYWPLVKWRHQNQQSVADFLSFALAPVSYGASQTLRNLLSFLIVSSSESSGTSQVQQQQQYQQHWPQNSANASLSQFVLLNSLLRRISYHIISCSYHLNQINVDYTPGSSGSSVKIGFCKLLLRRYKRMMQTMGALNHNHLSKLHEAIGPERSPHSLLGTSRTLPGFLLDRLALLEPATLAEITLASQPLEDLHGDRHKELVDTMLEYNLVNIMAEPRQAEQASQSLINLAKLIIGNLNSATFGSSSTSSSSLDRNQEFARKLDELETSKPSQWANYMSSALIYPWQSAKIGQFVAPQSYDLFLHPNLTTRFMIGMVKIEFKVDRPTRFVVLNVADLNIADISLWLKQHPNASSHPRMAATTLRQIQIRRVLHDLRQSQLHIELWNQLEPTQIHPSTTTNHNAPDAASYLSFGELPLQSASSENLYVIDISFNKTINLLQDGVELYNYSDYYAQPGQETKTILYTKFEPANARRIFPCFDEPQFKARFQLNLVHEDGHQVMFNSAKKEKVPYTSDEMLQMSVFEKTPIPMSTYLVSFVVCDGHNIKSITSRIPVGGGAGNGKTSSRVDPQRHIQIQIFAQFEYISQAEYASQLVPQLLAFYQSHLQFPYPFEKLDLMALPKAITSNGQARSPVDNNQTKQHQLGPRGSEIKQQQQTRLDTMENIGLMWFKSPLLLVDVNLISQNLIEQISMVISHQLAHQYFGNIVTLRDWRKDLWLYEALCQYLESIALSNVQTDWKLDEQFVVSSIQEALANDHLAIDSSAPGESPSEAGSGEASLVDQLLLDDNQQAPTSAIADAAEDYQPETDPSLLSPGQLKRGPAVLHMLLLNLLPTSEARLSLMKRCLATHRYASMSSSMFWKRFGDQLAKEASPDKLGLDVSRLFSISNASRVATKSALSDQTDLSDDSNDRVVFVTSPNNKQPPVNGKTRPRLSEPETVDRIRSYKLEDNLDLIAHYWMSQTSYPLVTATWLRDRIHLKQERFSPTWWSEIIEPEGPSETSEPTAHATKRDTDLSKVVVEDTTREKRSTDNEPVETAAIERHTWPIPLTMVSKFNMRNPHFLWFNQEELEISISNSIGYDYGSNADSKLGSPSFWFKLNVNQSSIVRVNYDERSWDSLIDILAKSHYSNHLLGPLDRANLLDDALTLMRCGKLSVNIAMNLTLYLEVGERDYMPWTYVLKHLDQMQSLLNQNPLWHRYIFKLLHPISSVIGWKDDGPHLMRKLRRSLFSVALQYGESSTVNKAKSEFKGWMKSNKFVVPNLQELVFVAGVRYGDQPEWFHCWQKYQQLIAIDANTAINLSPNSTGIHLIGGQALTHPQTSSSPILDSLGDRNEPNSENEKRQLLTALASTQNTWLLEQFLNYSLDPTKIQTHHLRHVMQILGKNPVARLYLWRFVRLNWASLMDPYSDLESRVSDDYAKALGTMILESTKHFATKLDLEEVKTFFDAKREQSSSSSSKSASWGSDIEQVIQQSLRNIESNIYWRDYIEPKLTSWLSHHDSLGLS